VEFLAGAVRIADGAYHCLALINPVVAVNPTTLDFGAIRAGSSSATQMVTITNYSPAPLTVSSLSFARGRPSEF
jgi:hypothetical protein